MNLIQKLFGSAPSVDLKSVIDEGAFLVDVRTPGEFNSGHIKGSVNIPLDSITQQLAKFKGKKNVIVFCRSGARSTQAKAILQQNGIDHVFNGGSWQNIKQFVK
jgi:rhodanese-related sulfurtransferase